MTFTQSNGINIPHLSASTVNKFITDRYGFYQSKVLGEKFKDNKYTARGKAVEGAINEWIETGNDNVSENAVAYFDKYMREAGIHLMEVQDVRDSVSGLADLAFDFYKEEFSDRPAKTQTKIVGKIDGINRDIVGYLDYLQDHVIRDCKVVSKTPSGLSQSYCIQGAFYKATKGLDVVFDFFVANKKPVMKTIQLSDDDYVFGLSYLTQAAKVIEELEECDNPKRVMELMSFPNLEAMYNQEEKKEAAKKYGIKMR